MPYELYTQNSLTNTFFGVPHKGTGMGLCWGTMLGRFGVPWLFFYF